MVGVSDFVLGPILGEGSFAQVFEATMKTHPGKKVAVKAVDGKKLVRFNKTQTVMTEKQVLATAKHPAIVKIYFTCQDASTLCTLLVLWNRI
jgi:serine/threonine protein kinase